MPTKKGIGSSKKSQNTPPEEEKESSINQLLQKASSWFSQGLFIPDKQKNAVITKLESSTLPDAPFVTLVVLSCVLATFGLINDSNAVVIGAMLVSPMLIPILNTALEYCTGDYKTILKASRTIGIGMGIVLILSAALSLIFYRLPYGADIQYSAEVLTYISPSLTDLLIALAAGSAAAFAVAHPRFSAVLPGASIALTLVPAICTAGIGISFLNSGMFLGASLLFTVNLAGIFFAAVLTFTLLGFKLDKAD